MDTTSPLPSSCTYIPEYPAASSCVAQQWMADRTAVSEGPAANHDVSLCFYFIVTKMWVFKQRWTFYVSAWQKLLWRKKKRGLLSVFAAHQLWLRREEPSEWSRCCGFTFAKLSISVCTQCSNLTVASPICVHSRVMMDFGARNNHIWIRVEGDVLTGSDWEVKACRGSDDWKATMIVSFTLNGSFMYEMNIMLNWRGL